jgi:hypothetical protein
MTANPSDPVFQYEALDKPLQPALDYSFSGIYQAFELHRRSAWPLNMVTNMTYDPGPVRDLLYDYASLRLTPLPSEVEGDEPPQPDVIVDSRPHS